MSKVSFMFGVLLSLVLMVAGASVDRSLSSDDPAHANGIPDTGAVVAAPSPAIAAGVITAGAVGTAQLRAVVREEMSRSRRS